MRKLIVATLLIVSSTIFAREKWPAASEDSKQRAVQTAQHEKELLQKLAPELAEWAAKGKPNIPGAAKPSDLPQADIPAFPGAEGGGKFTFGGRGGRVFVVTSLEDSGPGTFREACEAAGPRIVVFNVAGIIHLKSRVSIFAPYITIDGQKAPGDGICIAGASVLLQSHDAVVRYLRFRRGQMDVGDRDDSLGGDPVGNIMIDHCSCSWGFDENISMYRHMYDPPDGTKSLKLPTVNITIQWGISSEALDTFNHAFGGTWGGQNDTFHHDLFACNTGRNCSMGLGGDFNYINNVVFNWRHRTVDGGDETSRVNLIGNYFKPGPITNDGAPISYRLVKAEARKNKDGTFRDYGKFYVTGNVVDGNERVTKDNWDGGVQPPNADAEDAPPAPNGAPAGPRGPLSLTADQMTRMKADKPFPMAPVTIQSAKDAYEAILAEGGASLPKRDPVDTRIIEEVRTGKVTYTEGKGIITDPAQVGGYPEYKGDPIIDSDKDGIPDDWEKKYGLNPNDPTDAVKDLNGDGYSNIEKYLYGLDPTKKLDWKDPKNNVNPLSKIQLSDATK